MALLERVPRERDHIAFKMLLARLYNAGVKVVSLVICFGVAHTTLRRWGLALLSGDVDRINRAFCGQGAERKVTPEIEFYIRDRFHELYGSCRNYSKKIQEEVKKYFKKEVSAERLRWIFSAEREKLNVGQETQNLEAEHIHSREDEMREDDEKTGESGSGERANSCDTEGEPIGPGERGVSNCLHNGQLATFETAQRPIENDSSAATPNYSLWKGDMPYSGTPVSKRPRLVHHAGVLLFSPWMDRVVGDVRENRNIIRQWYAQVLLGAVNHEQSKMLSFSSLKVLIGPTVRALNHQRGLLKRNCGEHTTAELLKRNSRLLDIGKHRIFYYDPHAKEYTGELKTLKGWCGGKGRVSKIMNLDFIHTLHGWPCFVQHFDSYYDLRERFFLCTAAFRRIMVDSSRSLTWIVDRGIYSLSVLQRIVDMEDHIITWEKGYDRDGWNSSEVCETFICYRERNHREDLLMYEFLWQESQWERDARFRRLVVRARNPNGNEIEVAIIASDRQQEAIEIIKAMFNRWIQENDFSYLIHHYGINELTTRGQHSYSSLEGDLKDRQVRSREYRALLQEKRKLETAISRLLLKQKNHEKQMKKKCEQGERKQEAAQQEYRDSERQLEIYHGSATDEENHGAYKELKAKSKQCGKRLETLLSRLRKEEEASRKKGKELEAEISEKTREVEELEKRILETVTEESRLQALIEEQYLRLEMRGKAYMDAIRLSSRNIFYCLMEIFRPMYNNYRDDHVILRELTRSMGIIQKQEGIIDCQLIPAIEFQPRVRRLVSEFLERMSERINRYFADRYLPIRIRLLEDQSDLFGKEEKGSS